jgi:hypothetical protein
MEDKSHRWSEVVPPHTALSFAAIWDPDDGMVTFSGGDLLDADSCDTSTLHNTPIDANDYRSQILTLDGLSLPFSSGIWDTAGLSRANRVQFTAEALDETHSMLDPYMRYLEAKRKSDAERTARSEKARRRKQRIVHLDFSQLRVAAAMASVGSRIFRPFSARQDADDDDDQDSFTYDGLFEEVPATAHTFTSAPVLVHLNLVRLSSAIYRMDSF